MIDALSGPYTESHVYVNAIVNFVSNQIYSVITVLVLLTVVKSFKTQTLLKVITFLVTV